VSRQARMLRACKTSGVYMQGGVATMKGHYLGCLRV
jgi:hypothetical protein